MTGKGEHEEDGLVDLVEEMKKEEEVFFFQSGGGIRRLGRVSWVGGGVKGTFPNPNGSNAIGKVFKNKLYTRLLYTTDAGDEEDSVNPRGRRINKKKKIPFFHPYLQTSPQPSLPYIVTLPRHL